MSFYVKIFTKCIIKNYYGKDNKNSLIKTSSNLNIVRTENSSFHK